MMLKRISVVSSILTLFMYTSAVADELKMCYESWEPFQSKVNDQHIGLQVELVSKALTSLGHTVSYRQLPYARCIKEVQSGVSDGILLTSDEEPLIPTTVTPIFWEIGFVTRPDWKEASYTTLSAFNGKKAGLVHSYEYGDAIKQASQNWKVEMTADAESNLRKLSVGRIDFTLVDLTWAQIFAKREEIDIKILSPTFTSTPQFLYFNKENEQYVAPLSQAIQNLIEDGTVDELYQRFLGSSYAQILARNEATFKAE